MTQLDSVLKIRDITLLTNVCIVKAMVFPVLMYGCESWTIQKAEYQRIDSFKLWCWRRLLRVPLTARRSSQSILKEINPDYSLEGLMLKLQYFGHLMRWADSLAKTLMLGKTDSRRRRGQQGIRRLDGITDSMDMSLSKLWETVKDRGAWHIVNHGVTKSWTQLSDWTSIVNTKDLRCFFLCFKYIYIYMYIYDWSIVDLQCFRYTARWFNYANTHILFLKLFSIIGYYNILTMVPYGIQ